ncbi:MULTISPECIES: Dabb family protein [unclassified Diaminobutyricimonas]|uniref:Dabb family protein n=1 Tax=unclassified Diaminobutyricimonas TaxID=2643261 RepID=UPI0012F48F01|nr:MULTISPECIES: Dabb family protein [unclassified Diaminobutyricimonas]
MIRHVVTWKLNGADASTRAAQATEIADALNALDGVVPQIRAIKVGADVLGNGNWEVALVADFDSLDDLGGYQEHPAHQALLPMIRGHVAERSCVDFEV